MKPARFNFNLVSHRDLRKFMTLKMESEKWEFSSAHDATLAHYQYQTKIAYGFPHSRNMKLITKKLLREQNNNFILPFLYFNKKTMNDVLYENSEFLEEGIYYFRNSEGKRELYNYPIKSLEQIQKIVNVKYKKANNDMHFILEKSVKKPLIFDGNAFEMKAYVLIIRMGKKYHSFLYPTIFANFGKENIDKVEFMKLLNLENREFVDSMNPLMKKIYNLLQKAALNISNYLNVTNKVYSVENELKTKFKDVNYFKSEFQYNLYGIDITINEDHNPFLTDIIFNPIFGALDSNVKVGKEKAKLYNDIIDNFIIFYNNHKKLNFDNSSFVLLTDYPQQVQYKVIVGKKLFDENGESKFDDTLEYAADSQDFITSQGEELVQKILFENKDTLTNDNIKLLVKMGLSPIEQDNFINSDYLISSAVGGISEEFTVKGDLNEFVGKKLEKCEFEQNNNKSEKIVEKKIDELKNKEKKDEMLNIAKTTLPLLGFAYAAKKTYNAMKTKSKIKNIETTTETTITNLNKSGFYNVKKKKSRR